ncbi:BF3164 family lipoprotein [Phocaeicola sartorii]|jgi:hypothetical protein|uniref:BF3164 family lipoprotein n=1 Tax=Phocaeicola sartorii TaxID=671267 RepID=UPI0025881D8A|nr:BF3164 family lipoprotein [Phocaeicola sartorii]
MRNYIYYLLLLVLSLSCTSNKRKIDKNTQLGKLAYTNVNGTNLKNDSTIWGMKVDLVTDNRLIIQELSNELLYGVYRVEGEKLIKEGGFLTKGVGPFEMIHPDLWGNEGDSVFYISNYSGMVKEIYTVKKTDIYNKEKWKITKFPDPQECLFYPSIAILDDSICIVSGSKLNSINILSRVNLQTGSISDLDFSFPGFNLPSGFKIVEHMIYCDAQLLKHPRQNKLLYVCRLGKYAKILEMENRQIGKQIPLYSILPQYESVNNERKIKDDCLGGIIAKVTADKIYCLVLPYTRKEENENPFYKGMPNYFADEMVIFDWDGNLINAYRLDQPICNFGVDGTKNILYGTTLDGEEFVVRRFVLK